MTGPVIPPVAWLDIVGQLNTGDLLSFAGDGPMDYAIQFVEDAPYTHVGIVIKNGTDLWFWDAPGGGDLFPDPFSGNPAQPGARVADLNDVISYYMNTTPQGGGEVSMYVRQLVPPVTPEQQECLMTFLGLADGTPFPGTELKIPPPWNLGVGFAGSWMFGVTLHGTIAGTFFCAQLAAQSYMSMGLLPIWPKPANAYDPAIFNSNSSAELPLIGCALSVTQPVDYSEN